MNHGSAVVESCVVVPLFLFFALAIFYMFRMLMAEAHIHQSLCEAAVYGAQYCYLEERLMEHSAFQAAGSDQGMGENILNTGIIYKQFREYLGADNRVEQVVAGGRNGILITAVSDQDNPKVFVAKANYMIRLSVPIFGTFLLPRTNEVRQKAYVGYSREEGIEADDLYVYITPNEEVYHVSRSCSHLTRNIREQSGHGGYAPCSFCCKRENDTGKVYVTENGEAYHDNIHCLGLKRTVIRVKKSSVKGLSVCSRCGR